MPAFQDAAHHREITEALEKVEAGEIDRLIIEAPPRHTKSELASRRFPSWFLGRHPEKQIICASYNADMASSFGREVRNIVDSAEYDAVFPGVSLAPDSKAANRWHTNKQGVYTSAGVGTSLTGRGGHLVLIDDPFKDRKEADSESRRDDVWNWYRAVVYTRLMPGAAIVLINTRWHEDDLTGRILEQAKKTGERWHTVKLKAITDGKALWPEWYPLDVLERIKGTLGPREWLSLYQQSPTAEEGTFFKREWFRYYDKLPKHLNIYMTGDFAVTEDGGDYTELATWGVDPDGDIYVIDWWHGQTESLVWINEMLDRFEADNPLYFVGEQGPIRKAVEPILRRMMRERKNYCALEWLPTDRSKESAARSFQALVSNHRVHFPQTGWAERVIDQLLRFPAGRYDDAVDTCSLFGRFIHRVWNASKPNDAKDHLHIKPSTTLTLSDFEPNDRFARERQRHR